MKKVLKGILKGSVVLLSVAALFAAIKKWKNKEV